MCVVTLLVSILVHVRSELERLPRSNVDLVQRNAWKD